MTAPTVGADVPARTTTSISTVARDVSFDHLPHRDLDGTELCALAASVAADERLWGGDVDVSDGRRHYRSVYRDEHIDVWLLCWAPGSDTGWHDHDVSLRRGRRGPGPPGRAQPGAVPPRGRDARRRRRGLRLRPRPHPPADPVEGDAAGAVSVHVYSPPLQRLGQYHVDEFGVLRREVITYEDELRSFEEVA